MEGSVALLCIRSTFPDFQGPIGPQGPESLPSDYTFRVDGNAIRDDKSERVLRDGTYLNSR